MTVKILDESSFMHPEKKDIGKIMKFRVYQVRRVEPDATAIRLWFRLLEPEPDHYEDYRRLH